MASIRRKIVTFHRIISHCRKMVSLSKNGYIMEKRDFFRRVTHLFAKTGVISSKYGKIVCKNDHFNKNDCFMDN